MTATRKTVQGSEQVQLCHEGKVAPQGGGTSTLVRLTPPAWMPLSAPGRLLTANFPNFVPAFSVSASCERRILYFPQSQTVVTAEHCHDDLPILSQTRSTS